MIYTKETLLALEPAGADGVPTLAGARSRADRRPLMSARRVRRSWPLLAVGSAAGPDPASGTRSTARSSSSSTSARVAALFLTLRRRVPGRRAGHRLRGRHRGALRLRDHGADPGQGGDGPRSAARRSAGWRCRWPGVFLVLVGAGAALGGARGRRASAAPCRAASDAVGRAALHRLPVPVRGHLGAAARRHGGRDGPGQAAGLRSDGPRVLLRRAVRGALHHRRARAS